MNSLKMYVLHSSSLSTNFILGFELYFFQNAKVSKNLKILFITNLYSRFSEESRNLLKGFWNLQRRLSDLITIKNYKSLINLAFSHAKICQSDYVDIVDACFAIYYMEEYTSTFLQFSVLEFSGKHCNNLSSYGDCLVCSLNLSINYFYLL